MSDPSQPKERRLHPRFPIQGTVDLGPGEEGEQNAATLKDISMSGLSCLSTIAFEEMTVLEITMKLPPDGPSLTVGGAVVRCDPAGSDGYHVAIFFTAMDQSNTETLKQFIEIQHRATQST